MKFLFINIGRMKVDATELSILSLLQNINPKTNKNIDKTDTVNDASKLKNLLKIIDIPLTPPTTKLLGNINKLKAIE